MKITFDPQFDSLALIQAIYTAVDMSRDTADRQERLNFNVPTPPARSALPETDGTLAGRTPPPAPDNVTLMTTPPVSYAAPETPAAPLPSATYVGVERDASGMPWDSRIHAATKAKTADGNWRARRNLDAALKVSVEAEIRATMALPVPAPSAPVAAAPVAPPAPPPAPPPPPPAEAPVVEGFPQFMSWVSSELAAGRIKQEALVTAHKELGLPSLLALNTRPDLIPAIRDALK